MSHKLFADGVTRTLKLSSIFEKMAHTNFLRAAALLFVILLYTNLFAQRMIGIDFYQNDDFRTIVDTGAQITTNKTINLSVMPTITFKLKGKVSFQTGIHFKQAPVAYRFRAEVMPVKYSGDFLLELPISFLYNLEHNKIFVFQPCFGLRTGFVLSPEELIASAGAPYYYFVQHEKMSKITYSMYFALKESVKLNRHFCATFTLAYNNGFNSISREKVLYFQNNVMYGAYIYNKNCYWQAGVGVNYVFN